MTLNYDELPRWATSPDRIDSSSFGYVRAYYGVPAKRGARVIADGKPGVITKGDGAHIRIRLDGEKHARPWHPDVAHGLPRRAGGPRMSAASAPVTRTARKRHACDATSYYGCARAIEPGDRYSLMTVFMIGAPPFRVKVCPPCSQWFDGCTPEEILNPDFGP